MPVFHSGHFRVFWHVLFDAAARFDADLGDREIVIISPWISDVTTHTSGWSDSAVASAFDPHGGGSIESLSDVLGRLVKLGYNVTVVTLSTTGKWLPKARNTHLDRERVFMEKVRRLGVTCMLRNNIHKKYVKTPFSTFSGSVNISFNGLSGRTQEGADYFVKSVHQQDYQQRKQGVAASLVGAKDYFSASIPITTWLPPSFDQYPDAQHPDLADVDAETYPAVAGSEYPEMTPDGFLPPGNIAKSEIGNSESLSLKAQCSQLIQRTGMWAIWLLHDETVEGQLETDLINQLMGAAPADDASAASEAETLPNIVAIKQLLLPSEDNPQLIEHLVSRLGLTNQQETWMQWRNLTGELLDGLEYFSDILSGDSPPTPDDAETLAKLTSQFDMLSP